MKYEDIARVIEGVLFVAGDGVEIDEFKRKFDINDKEFNKCLDLLKAKYNAQSGINIITYKTKVQLCSNPNIVDDISEILNPIRERTLTKAALETVAIIAYKQPITRLEIENIRNVKNADYAIDLLIKFKNLNWEIKPFFKKYWLDILFLIPICKIFRGFRIFKVGRML